MVLWKDERWVRIGYRVKGSEVQCLYVIRDCLSWVHLYHLRWGGAGAIQSRIWGFLCQKKLDHIPWDFIPARLTGNVRVILDSGTSSTCLVEPSYSIFWYSFRAATSYLKSIVGNSLFDTCSKEALLTSPSSIFYSRTRYSSKPNLICSVNFYDLEHSDCVSWLERTCIEIVLPPQNLI
jgi:hypothetical protein